MYNINTFKDSIKNILTNNEIKYEEINLIKKFIYIEILNHKNINDLILANINHELIINNYGSEYLQKSFNIRIKLMELNSSKSDPKYLINMNVTNAVDDTELLLVFSGILNYREYKKAYNFDPRELGDKSIDNCLSIRGYENTSYVIHDKDVLLKNIIHKNSNSSIIDSVKFDFIDHINNKDLLYSELDDMPNMDAVSGKLKESLRDYLIDKESLLRRLYLLNNTVKLYGKVSSFEINYPNKYFIIELKFNDISYDPHNHGAIIIKCRILNSKGKCPVGFKRSIASNVLSYGYEYNLVIPNVTNKL